MTFSLEVSREYGSEEPYLGSWYVSVWTDNYYVDWPATNTINQSDNVSFIERLVIENEVKKFYRCPVTWIIGAEISILL